jgi:hypothetical protein
MTRRWTCPFGHVRGISLHESDPRLFAGKADPGHPQPPTERMWPLPSQHRGQEPDQADHGKTWVISLNPPLLGELERSGAHLGRSGLRKVREGISQRRSSGYPQYWKYAMQVSRYRPMR